MTTPSRVSTADRRSRPLLLPLVSFALASSAALLPAQTDWAQSTSPGARADSAMAFDSARGRTVLFSGASAVADTWEWDSVKWIERRPQNSPPFRSQHAMAYDAARARVVLFGGTTVGALADTWEWDGTDWTKRTPVASPAARWGHSLAYDASRARIVLFGGTNGTKLADTWEWDGTSWTQRAPAASPPARSNAALCYDSARQRCVLFGGQDSTPAYLGDTWEWNGTTWLQRAPRGEPAGALAARDGVRLGARQDRAVRRRRPGVVRRHVGVGRHQLDAALPGGQPAGAAPARDGLRLRARPDALLRRQRLVAQRRPGHLGLGRHELGAALSAGGSGRAPRARVRRGPVRRRDPVRRRGRQWRPAVRHLDLLPGELDEAEHGGEPDEPVVDRRGRRRGSLRRRALRRQRGRPLDRPWRHLGVHRRHDQLDPALAGREPTGKARACARLRQGPRPGRAVRRVARR
jgi:hypothetical protein